MGLGDANPGVDGQQQCPINRPTGTTRSTPHMSCWHHNPCLKNQTVTASLPAQCNTFWGFVVNHGDTLGSLAMYQPRRSRHHDACWQWQARCSCGLHQAGQCHVPSQHPANKAGYQPCCTVSTRWAQQLDALVGRAPRHSAVPKMLDGHALLGMLDLSALLGVSCT